MENEEMLMTMTLEARMVTMVTPEAREMRKTGDASSWKGFNASHGHINLVFLFLPYSLLNLHLCLYALVLFLACLAL